MLTLLTSLQIVGLDYGYFRYESSDWWGKNTALKQILSSWGDHPTTGHSGFLQGAYSLNPTQCNYELAISCTIHKNKKT